MNGCGSELNAIRNLIGEIFDVEEDDVEDNDVEGGGDDSGDEDDNDDDDDDDHNGEDFFNRTDTEFNDRIQPILPLFLTILKYMSQATMMLQPHDVSRLHAFLKKFLLDYSDSLMMERDESQVLLYMPLFQELMEYHKIDSQSQRTFFWVVCNFQRKLAAASVKLILEELMSRRELAALTFYIF